MQFKEGIGWKACYDEATGRYTAERGGCGNYDLYEITEEIFAALADGMSDSDTYKLICSGRHLYMDVNDRCGPPYTVVFDDEYAQLCPWAHIVGGEHVWPKALTDAAVALFESEKPNREYRERRARENGGSAMKKLLIVIDMQNDFIDGALGTPEAQEIVEAVKEKIRSYPPEAVFATMDTHGPDYLTTQEGRMLPVAHCIRDTEGWAIRPEIAALLTKAKVFEKPTFGSVALAEAVSKMEGLEEIELVGLCTDICVVSNALMLKAFLPEVTIRVDARCCAGVTPEKHHAALETMRSCQIEVVS